MSVSGLRSLTNERTPGKVAARIAGQRGLLLVGALLLAACGDGGSTGPKLPSASDPAAGTFALTTVNTQPLPFTLYNDTGFRLDFTASTLALQSDGQFVMAQTTVETVAGFASTYQDTVRGTWTQNTGSLSLKATDGTTTPATWDGTQVGMDLDADGQTLKSVYKKNK